MRYKRIGTIIGGKRMKTKKLVYMNDIDFTDWEMNE